MVAARIDGHVRFAAHVAVDALRRRVHRTVPVVCRGCEYFGRVAARAERVTFGSQRGRMRLVAVAAGNAGRVHRTLQKGSVNVDLVENLTVCVIQALIEEDRPVAVQKRCAVRVIVRQLRASRVANRAGFDLPGRRRSRRQRRDPCVRGENPVPTASGGDGKGLGRIHGVLRSRAVAGFAADADPGKRRRVRVCRQVVVLVQIRRVALRAHAVPVEESPGPVEGIVTVDRFPGIQGKPALSADGGRTGIPGDGEGLPASVGEFDQVLLQWLDTESVGDRKVTNDATSIRRLYAEFIAGTIKNNRSIVVAELDPIEIRCDRVIASQHHRPCVMGFRPERGLLLMAAAAGFGADELRSERSGTHSLRRGLLRTRDHCQCRKGHQHCAFVAPLGVCRTVIRQCCIQNWWSANWRRFGVAVGRCSLSSGIGRYGIAVRVFNRLPATVTGRAEADFDLRTVLRKKSRYHERPCAYSCTSPTDYVIRS